MMNNDHDRRPPLHLLFVLAVALPSAALACRFSPGFQNPAEPQGFLPLTEVANITPPPPPRQACSISPAAPEQPSWNEPAQAARPLLEYLNAGGDPAAISAPAGTSLEWARPDLDGDGWVDLAAVITKENQAPVAAGTLLVYRCQGNQFELLYSAASNPDLSAPMLLSIQDLDADGADDLLVSRERCGAHTCSQQVEFLTLHDGQLMDRLEGNTDDLPSPSVEVVDMDEQPAQINITATGINSVGAGPFRPFTRVWSWDETAELYRPTDEYQTNTSFRIHHLHDADQAARQGNFNQAMNGYQRVIEDNNLMGWIEPEREREILSAYARFRLLTTSLQTDDQAAAANWIEEIRSQVAPASAGARFVDLAEAFWLTYQQTEDYNQACHSAQAYAAAHGDDILDPLYFGYSNPTYSPEDVCPLIEE